MRNNMYINLIRYEFWVQLNKHSCSNECPSSFLQIQSQEGPIINSQTCHKCGKHWYRIVERLNASYSVCTEMCIPESFFPFFLDKCVCVCMGEGGYCQYLISENLLLESAQGAYINIISTDCVFIDKSVSYLCCSDT